jgi:hypothetical protein
VAAAAAAAAVVALMMTSRGRHDGRTRQISTLTNY